MDPKWPYQKKQWYRVQLKKNEPERAKAEYKAYLERQLKDME